MIFKTIIAYFVTSLLAWFKCFMTLPKNFPGRKNERRISALKRMEERAAINKFISYAAAKTKIKIIDPTAALTTYTKSINS